MKTLEKVNPFETTVEETDFGSKTTFVAHAGVSAQCSISYQDKTLLANYVNNENGGYKLVYTVIDTAGNHDSYEEDDGVSPTLFLSPENEAYVSVMPYHPDKELEISIPVFDREKTEKPKGDKPFVGDFVGATKQFSIFFDVDIWSDKKPDKMLAIEFKNGEIKKKHNIKIPLPRRNKIFIADNEIHLLAEDKNGWLHRQIDEKGNIIRQRLINRDEEEYFYQIFSLSFEKISYVWGAEDEGKITIVTIFPDGKCETKTLADIKFGYFNSWKPDRISENTYTAKFNGDKGNGWFTIKNDMLLELFCEVENGYKNLITNEILDMDNKSMIISSINKTTDNSYAVVFYPQTDRGTVNKELTVVHRSINTSEAAGSAVIIEFDSEHVSAGYPTESAEDLSTLHETIDNQCKHDGVSTITVSAHDWGSQHDELWSSLVPPQGAAQTVQGEIIRISGRINYELYENGGCNWDTDFRNMLDALLIHFASHNALSADELTAANEFAAPLRAKGDSDDDAEILCQLAVKWVLANPNPIALGKTKYKR